MKTIILSAMLSGIFFAVISAGRISNYLTEGLIVGIITIAVLVTGSYVVIQKDRKSQALR